MLISNDRIAGGGRLALTVWIVLCATLLGAGRTAALDLDTLMEKGPWQAARQVVVQLSEGTPDERKEAAVVMDDIITLYAERVGEPGERKGRPGDQDVFLEQAGKRLAAALRAQKISVRADAETLLVHLVDALHEPLAFGSRNQQRAAERLIVSVADETHALQADPAHATQRAAARVREHAVDTLGRDPGPPGSDQPKRQAATGEVKLSARPEEKPYDRVGGEFTSGDEVVLRLLADQLQQESAAVRHAGLKLALDLHTKVRLGLRDGGAGGRAQAERVLEGVRANLRTDDATMRWMAARISGLCKDISSAPSLIELLEDESPEVRAQAADSLAAISGFDYGLKPVPWRAWLDR